VGSFLALTSEYFLEFERRADEVSEKTAVIIRLMGSDVLLNWMRSLLMRQIFSVVSFLPTQESIDPGESAKKGRANLRCAGNDCTNNGEKCENLAFQAPHTLPLSLTKVSVGSLFGSPSGLA
jgi:hypothetical protein